MADLTHMLSTQPGEVVMDLCVAPARRAIGVGSVAVLGLLLIWLGFSLPAAFGFRVIMVLLGAVALWFALRLWDASRLKLVLTRERLSDSAGRVLAEVQAIKSVERGALAAKPSNGFALVLRDRQPAAWAPGIWWRIGRRVGVGGLTSAGGARAMAEVLQTLLAQRPESPE